MPRSPKSPNRNLKTSMVSCVQLIKGLEKAQNVMVKRGIDFKRIFLSACLMFIVFILLELPIGEAASVNATYYASGYNVLNGTYLSGSLSTSLQTVDSDYFVVSSSPSATSALSYSPSAYSLFGGTTYVSGSTGDLVSNNDVHMNYRSYPSVTSAQALYAHQEATTIGGNSYFVQKPESADLAGASLSASMAATGRQLFGRFVYPLEGMSTIPASTWTESYRAWKGSDPTIAYDSVGSGNNGDGRANITWTHVVGSGPNRFMVIGLAIKTDTVTASSVTVGGQAATLLRSDPRVSEVRGEIWYLINPDPGSKTVTVTLSGSSKASGGSISYTGVDQSSPIDNHQGVLYAGTSPSVSLTTTTANDWLFSNLAISGTATVTAHGVGQVHRFYDIGTGGSGTSRAGDEGDDKPTTTLGSYTMSWNVSFYSETVAQAVAFKPAPSTAGHVDLDILILKSDDTVRTAVATNVAASGALASTIATLSGTYSWTTYTVVDQTDYLEVDYYVEVTAATFGVAAYLRVDDGVLPLVDQTRVSGVLLPSEYTSEVELTGASNTFSWTQLDWAVDSAWTTGAVSVTLQLYNYVLGAYSVSGDGFISYASSVTASIDETKAQVVAINPQQFRDSAGAWKILVRGVKTVSSTFDLKADLVEFRPHYNSEYAVSIEFQFSSMTNETPTQLSFVLVNEYDVTGVSVTVQVWNCSASEYVGNGQGYLRYVSSDINATMVLDISANPQSYTANESARIRITGVLSTPIQYRQRTNQVRLDYYYEAPSFAGPGFNWLPVFLYALPLPFMGLLPWILGARRKNKGEPRTWKETGTFSEQFGMTHEEMVGKKMLLEIDPASDYNLALSSFVSEARSSGESLFILTNKDSALHSVFSEADNVDFLLLSSKARYPQPINERETLLPSNDLSVILNACTRTQLNNGEKTINLLVDNLSDITRRSGLEKAYNFTRLLLEAIASSETTALFVFIPTAHDQETCSSIRGLFHVQLTYAKNGPEVGGQ